MRVIGLDPGLRRTGWGVIEADGNRLRHVANGVVASDPARPVAERLVQLHEGISAVLAEYAPDWATGSADEAIQGQTIAFRSASLVSSRGPKRFASSP